MIWTWILIPAEPHAGYVGLMITNLHSHSRVLRPEAWTVSTNSLSGPTRPADQGPEF
jgi:hypothetical protein